MLAATLHSLLPKHPCFSDESRLYEDPSLHNHHIFSGSRRETHHPPKQSVYSRKSACKASQYINGCRFLIGDYDFFRPHGLWFHPAGHHERDDPSHPDYHRQPDGRPQGRHDRRLHVRYLFLYPVLAGTERVAVVCCTV